MCPPLGCRKLLCMCYLELGPRTVNILIEFRASGGNSALFFFHLCFSFFFAEIGVRWKKAIYSSYTIALFKAFQVACVCYFVPYGGDNTLFILYFLRVPVKTKLHLAEGVKHNTVVSRSMPGQSYASVYAYGKGQGSGKQTQARSTKLDPRNPHKNAGLKITKKKK